MPYEVHSVIFTQCPHDWSWDTRRIRLPDHDLWFVREGEGEILDGKSVYQARRGSCFLLQPGRGYLARHNPQKPLTVHSCHFSMTGTTEDFPFVQVIPDIDFFTTLFKRLEQSEEPSLWLGCLMEEFQQSPNQQKKCPSCKEERVERLKQYIRLNLNTRLTLDCLAETACLSRNQTVRIFRDVTGKTLQQYIRSKRLSHAEQLLRESNLPIQRIAELSGYQDAAYFCRHFRARNGISPRQFRFVK